MRTGGDGERQRRVEELKARVERAEREYLSAKISYELLKSQPGRNITPALLKAARHFEKAREQFRRSLKALIDFDAYFGDS